MTQAAPSTLFLVTQPGLEPCLAREAQTLGFEEIRPMTGGILVAGGLSEAVRANLTLRTAVRVLWRVASFRAMHLAQLDKRSKKLPWRDWLRDDVPVRVEATCRKSKIYHGKAAAQRVEAALKTAGVQVAPEAEVVVKLRIEDDLCTMSLDTTGDALHRRGHKTFVGKAPLREGMAAGFLWELGYDGSQMVVDPMCGSGTIVLEAAEIAMNLLPGRSRGFAFERFAGGDAGRLRREYLDQEKRDWTGSPRFFGFDRDQGAVRGATQNAQRAGVAAACAFACQSLSDLDPPEGAPGIVLANPPYGGRIGNRKQLFGLYGALGRVLADRFQGWRVGLVTSDAGLAKAAGLPLTGFGPVDHSGTKVTLWHGRIGDKAR